MPCHNLSTLSNQSNPLKLDSSLHVPMGYPFKQHQVNTMPTQLAKTMTSALNCKIDINAVAQDCIARFNEFDWLLKPNGDLTEFDALCKKGHTDDLSMDELNHFMEIISHEGHSHAYFDIYNALKKMHKLD
jgi:hypothetical protein